MSNLFKIFLGLILIPVAWFSWAFAATKIWLWFIVTGFGVSPIDYHTAMGLSVFSSLLLHGAARSSELKPEIEKSILKGLLTSIITPFVLLLFAWIIHHIF
jgi:hypothetical protein